MVEGSWRLFKYESVMIRPISKFLFPHKPRELRQRLFKNLLFTLLTSLLVGGIVGVTIYIKNK
jgi:hypothetical protein